MSKSNGDFVDFKTIKSSVSILQILDRYHITEKLKRTGDNLSGPCPLHNGDNPTQFRVSLVKNCWNCFGRCKSGGNILDFVSKKENVSIRQAALLIQEWFSIPSEPTSTREKQLNSEHKVKVIQSEPEPKIIVNETNSFNAPLTFTLKNLSSHQYLFERGIRQDSIDAFSLGYCNKGIFAGRIVIPIHNWDGQLVAYAGRFPGQPEGERPKYKLPKGFRKSLEVFNIHRARKEDPNEPLVIVEGFFDCIKVWQAGIGKVVALMGSSLSDTQSKLVLKMAGPSGKVVLLLDADDAGRTGAKEAQGKLCHSCYVKTVLLQESGQQPDHLSPDQILQILK